jgi:peptide/nickel transport system permease protein
LVAYLIRRFFLMLLTLFGMSVLIFVLLRVMPGNISDILFESAGLVNPAEKAKIE